MGSECELDQMLSIISQGFWQKRNNVLGLLLRLVHRGRQQPWHQPKNGGKELFATYKSRRSAEAASRDMPFRFLDCIVLNHHRMVAAILRQVK